MFRHLLVCTALFVIASLGHAAGTTSSSSADGLEGTAEEIAALHYQAGLEEKAKAWKQEERAAGADEARLREKYLARAQRAYQKAIKSQGSALKAYPRYFEAANELGYALRKTGDYRKAVGAYNYAIGLKPDFFEAIEYRGEAYLAMGMFENTQQAYMTLFRADPELASQLMLAMENWLSEADEADSTFADWADWVRERQALARMSADLSQATPRQW